MGQSAVNISINGRKLKIACPSGQESALFAAAKDLDSRLNELLANGNFASTEQGLLMVALNLANELLQLKEQTEQEREQTASKIALLQSTIEQALTEQSSKSA